MTAAETLERYLHQVRRPEALLAGGGESMIAALDNLIQNSSSIGVQEIIIGMAHRGRLNVLVNTRASCRATCSPIRAARRWNCRPAM